MSNKELDNLFKNKLEEFEKNPPQNLWSQIDDQLEPRKKKPIVWFLSVAASIILLFTIGWSVFLNEDKTIVQNDNVLALNEPIKQANSSTNKTKDSTNEIDIASDNNVEQKIENAVVQKSSEEKNTKITKEKVTSLLEKTTSTTKVESDDEHQIELKKVDKAVFKSDNLENIAENKKVDATATTKTASNDTKGKSIVFDISEFSNNNTLAQNTEEEKKESKLKKLFNIAKDLKEGESGLKNLREAKNDLFALGNKKDENGK